MAFVIPESEQQIFGKEWGSQFATHMDEVLSSDNKDLDGRTDFATSIKYKSGFIIIVLVWFSFCKHSQDESRVHVAQFIDSFCRAPTPGDTGGTGATSSSKDRLHFGGWGGARWAGGVR